MVSRRNARCMLYCCSSKSSIFMLLLSELSLYMMLTKPSNDIDSRSLCCASDIIFPIYSIEKCLPCRFSAMNTFWLFIRPLLSTSKWLNTSFSYSREMCLFTSIVAARKSV